MAAPSSVFTIALVAQMLGEDETLLHEIATNMEPEDGCLWVHDVEERETVAFTPFGIESLKELIEVHEGNQARHPAE
jgi:hypothetical protein